VGLLELMRRELGFPIEVTSGYRCTAHNRTVGGSPKSWHMLFATDIRPQDLDPEKLAVMHDWALDESFGGIGLYEGHIHLDLRPERVLWRG